MKGSRDVLEDWDPELTCKGEKERVCMRDVQCLKMTSSSHGGVGERGFLGCGPGGVCVWVGGYWSCYPLSFFPRSFLVVEQRPNPCPHNFIARGFKRTEDIWEVGDGVITRTTTKSAHAKLYVKGLSKWGEEGRYLHICWKRNISPLQCHCSSLSVWPLQFLAHKNYPCRWN